MISHPASIRLLLSTGLVAALALLGCSPLPDSTASEVGEPPPTVSAEPIPPTYETIALPTATVHWVTIPDPVNYPLQVAVTEPLTPIAQQVSQVCTPAGCVAAAINAGFFDPNNGLTTSHVTVDGVLVADPNQNPRLMGNPDLTPYLDTILNRSEFRRYDCGGTPRYAITAHREPAPVGCVLKDAVGAGPQILPQDTAEAEGFRDRTVSPPRDALGSQSLNARSALGIKADGSLVLAMVAQVPGVSPSGLTLPEFAQLMADRGVVQALNLDGGSSSSLVFDGTVHYGRLNQAGEWVQRPVKSILWVAQP
jgi:hypothetical protein